MGGRARATCVPCFVSSTVRHAGWPRRPSPASPDERCRASGGGADPESGEARDAFRLPACGAGSGRLRVRGRLSPSPRSRRGNPQSHRPQHAAPCGASIPTWWLARLQRHDQLGLQRSFVIHLAIIVGHIMDCQSPYRRLLPRCGQDGSSGEGLRSQPIPRSSISKQKQSSTFAIDPEEALPYGHRGADAPRSKPGLKNRVRSSPDMDFHYLFQRNMVPATAACR